MLIRGIAEVVDHGASLMTLAPIHQQSLAIIGYMDEPAGAGGGPSGKSHAFCRPRREGRGRMPDPGDPKKKPRRSGAFLTRIG